MDCGGIDLREFPGDLPEHTNHLSLQVRPAPRQRSPGPAPHTVTPAPEPPAPQPRLLPGAPHPPDAGQVRLEEAGSTTGRAPLPPGPRPRHRAQ